ncbi:MAG: tetratricopeptide repeat protein [Bdellovibrionales bacterium]
MPFMILALVLSVCWGGPRTKDALTSEFGKGKFRANLKPGFHFNEKAPHAVQADGTTVKPNSISARTIEFGSLPENLSNARATVFVCDDEVTFCESEVITLNGNSTAAVASPARTAPKSGIGKSTRTRVNRLGFIEDNLPEALARAQEKGQLILIDFSARWCPSCVRLEKEIFGQKVFKRFTKNMVKLKVDVDKFENSVVGDKFNIKLIPTLLVINAQQEEIDRIIDYQPISILEGFFTAIQEDPVGIKDLSEKAKTGDPAIRLRLGKRLLASGRFKEAEAVFAALKPTPPALLTAKVEGAARDHQSDEKDEKAKTNYARVLREAIQAEPGSTRSLDWRARLVSVSADADEKTKLKKEGVEITDALLADKAKLKAALETDDVGEFTGFEPFLVAIRRAELATAGEVSEAESVAAWRKAAEVVGALKIPPRATGALLRYLIVLNSAKMFDEADRLTLSLLKRDPGNPEVERRRLKVLFEQKRYNEAIRTGRKALKTAYGRNEFWVVEVLARALTGAKQFDQARKLLDRYLARHEMDWPNMKGSKKALVEIRASLPQG